MISSDGKYFLFADSANSTHSGNTIAVWNPETRTPHPEYIVTRELEPRPTHEFILQYASEIPEPPPNVLI